MPVYSSTRILLVCLLTFELAVSAGQVAAEQRSQTFHVVLPDFASSVTCTTARSEAVTGQYLGSTLRLPCPCGR